MVYSLLWVMQDFDHQQQEHQKPFSNYQGSYIKHPLRDWDLELDA